METIRIGIDLGTTNTLACYNKNGEPTLISFPQSGKMLPSVLFVDDDGTEYIGEKARNKGKKNPENRICSSKTFMGDSQKTWVCNGKKYTPTLVATEILKEVKRNVIKKCKLKEDANIEAVITVPAEFNSNQREETEKAGKAAGLKVLRIITEPMAAAITAATEMELYKRILVVDIGGGTYDLSILEASKEGNDRYFKAIAIGGDRHLGGDNFDELLLNYIIEYIANDTGLDFSSSSSLPKNLQESYSSIIGSISDEARKVKEELTESEEAEIDFPNLFEYQNDMYDLRLPITRDRFNEICQDLYDEIFDRLDDFIQKNDKSHSLKEIILAGGTCYIPHIKEEMARRYGYPVNSELDLSTLVVTGAYYIASDTDITQKGIKDILAHSLGIEIYNNANPTLSKILYKNDEYPCSNKDIYTTVDDFQEEISINVYEAASDKEDVADIKEHDLYGSFILKGIERAKAGVPQIEVTFSYDISCCLTVTAKDLKTGASKEVFLEKGKTKTSSQEVDPMDILLLMDTSGSMYGKGLAGLKSASIALVSEMVNLDINRVGLISFDNSVRVLSKLSQDKEKLVSDINLLSAFGGTDLAGALERAKITYENSGSQKIAIIVTDGYPNDKNKALAEAQNLSNSGVRVIAIGAGSDIGENFLRDLAGKNDYYLIENMGVLKETFKTVVSRLQKRR